MLAKSFLERIDDLADAPERLPGIRKVILAAILHSAISSPGAGARAHALREAVARKRVGLGTAKHVSILPEPTQEDLPPGLSDTPLSLFDRLGNVASIAKGLSQIQRTDPGRYPLVVTAETRGTSSTYEFEGPAAIVPLVSSTGHGDASLKRLHYQDGRYAVGNILAVVQPLCPELIRARFIYEYLSAFKEELLVARMVGTANVSLTVNKLKEVPLPLVSGPTLDRIDDLMALCDRLEAQLQERDTGQAALARAALARFADAPTPANLDLLFHDSFTITPADLRKTILTLAIQGHLVPQDPNDEGIEALLSRNDEQRGRVAKTDRRADVDCLPLLSGEDRWEIPAAWTWRALADLVLFIDYRGKTPTKLSSGIRLITAKNVRKGAINRCPEEFLSERDYAAWMTRGFPKAGDVLFTTEAPMGNVAVVDLKERFALAQRVICFRGYGAVDPDFLVLHILSDQFQFVLDKQGTGVTAKGIKAAKLKLLPIALPPLPEQRRIVAKVDQFMALVDQWDSQLAAARTTSDKLLSALVAELTSSPLGSPTAAP